MPETPDNPTILIADDETHIVYILQAKLEQAGYNVHVARNGQDAFKAAQTHRPTLCITDFNMPVMDGLQFAMSLEANPDTKGTPVIMLTGRGYAVPEEDKARTHIIHMESKPFSARHLLAKVQEILAGLPAAA